MLRGNRPEEIAQAEATAHAQQAALEAARNGPRRQEIDQAQADYCRRHCRLQPTPKSPTSAWKS